MKRQRGIALITAILVVSIASIAATAVLLSAHGAVRRSANLFESEAAWWYAQGLESWGISILQRDAQETEIDALNEVWAQPVEALPVDQGLVRGSITDLQGRYNVNNLISNDAEAWRLIFQRLLGCLEGVDAFASEGLVQAITDWLDADDQQTFPGGAEDLTYMNLQPPYRAANQPITSITELQAVQSMSAEIYAALRPHITALPVAQGPTLINLNTASLPVLCALSQDGLSPALQTFEEERLELPLENLEQVNERKLFSADFEPQRATVSSQYFLINGEAFIGTGRVSLYSVVARQTGQPPIILVHRLDTD